MSKRMNEVDPVMSEPSDTVDLTKSDTPDEPAAASAEVPSAEVPTERVTFQSMADRLTLGLLASVIGAVLVFVSAFLTWATTHSKSAVGKLVSGGTTATLGIDGSRLGTATLVLSIAALALVGVMLLPATKPYAWKILIGSGALVALLAIIELFQIPATPHPKVAGCGVNGVVCTFHRSIGPGVWFTLIAGLLVAAGAYVHHIRPVQFRSGPAPVRSRPSPTPDHETVE